MDALALIALAVMAVGLAGTVIPGMPSVLLVFAAAAVYALVTRFAEFGVGWLLLMAVIAAAASAVDFIAAPALARRFGASKWGVLGAVAGLIVGFIVGGPLGLLIGPLIGAVAAELVFGNTVRQSLRSGLGTAVGFLAAMVADVTAALLIMALFAVLVLT